MGWVGLGRDGLGWEGCGEPKPPPTGVDLTEQEREVLAELREVPSYRFDFAKDLAQVRDWLVQFPRLDIADQARIWRAYKRDKPLKANSNARAQFTNWLKIAEEKRVRASPRGRSGFGGADPVLRPLGRAAPDEPLTPGNGRQAFRERVQGVRSRDEPAEPAEQEIQT